MTMLRLTAEREDRRWSRAELARRAGIDAADLSRVESGRLVPYPRMLQRLADALEVPPEELLRPVVRTWRPVGPGPEAA